MKKDVMILAGTGQIGLAIARVNSISPGIIVTPLAIDEFNGLCGAFITGADFLIDGSATASFFYGPLKPQA